MGEWLGVDEPENRLVQRDARRDEDRKHNEETGDPLGAKRAHQEGHADGDRRRGVTKVVDEIREERDGACDDEDRHLRERREPEDAEADGNHPKPCPRANDRAVDETVRMSMPW